jgi:hypothetical protein
MVDLNECSPGDYLITRNGSLFVYREKNFLHPLSVYPHIISNSKQLTSSAYHTVTDDGQVYSECKSDLDVIEIVPQTNSNTPYFELYEKLRLYKRTSEIAS